MSRYYRSILNVQAGGVIPVSDTDAEAFLTAAGIINVTQRNAANDLFIDLKNAGLYTKLNAFYPVLGGLVSSHKYNGKDPRDLDAAYRLTFFGGITHSANGIQGNGTNGYVNTHFNHNEIISVDDFSFGVYTQNFANNFNCLMGMGSSVGGEQRSYIFQNVSTDRVVYTINRSSDTPVSVKTRGNIFVSRNSSHTMNLYTNSTFYTAGLASINSLRDIDFYLLAWNRDGGAQFFSDNTISFAYISKGLLESDLISLNTIINNYQTALSRNV